MRGARTDLETSISFSYRRVSKSDVENQKKLKRVLSWVKETINDKKIIGENSLEYVYRWIDTS